MAENSNKKLTPEVVQTMTSLTSVRRISDLPQIQVYDIENERIKLSNNFNNSYILSSTYLEDESRYYNYRVKLNELTYYLNTISTEEISAFRNIFDYFVNTLKEQTENSYVRFKPLNTDYNLNEPLENYAYTFDYQLSYIQNEYSYVFSYNEYDENGEIINEYSTYAYVNKLKPGLVTDNVLEEYVQLTLGRILGVPSTPAYVSEAIDSVIEFVDWFKGYNKDEDGLRALIDKINSKDNEIVSSYTAADNEIIAKINSLDADASVQGKTFITGFKQEDGLIKNVTRKQIDIDDIENLRTELGNSNLIAGTNISIDSDKKINCYIDIDTTNNNNKLTIGTTDYFLTLSNDGKLSFSKYTPIDLTNITGTKTFEYNSGAHTFTVSAKPTKECIVIDKWENNNESSNITYSANSTISASVTSYYSTSYTLTVKETDSNHATKPATVNVNYTTYSYWCGVSVNDTITSIDTLTRSTTYNSGKPDRIYFNSSLFGGNSAYIYFAIKSNASTFYFTTGTNDTQTPGGIVPAGTITIPRYDMSFNLYRSDEKQSGACNVRLG